MTHRLDFIVPGDPAQRTGGYLYDAHIVTELRRLGWTVAVHGLLGRFPEADATARDALERTLATLPSGRLVVVDGLALGGLPEVAIRHGCRLRLVALVHHPLADERGLSLARRHCLLASERAALAAVGRVITTSPWTARRLADFGLQPSRVRTVEPGVTPLALARADGEPPRLLCVGTVSPRKGQDLLVRALARLRDTPWHCDCIGSSTRDPDFAGAVAGLIHEAGLYDRIQLHGECDDAHLRAAYAGADLFVLPSHYEGYGMVVTEAIAAGLPVLTTTGGALSETLPPGAGIAVPPDDVDALTEALAALIGDRARRHALREGARKARAALRDWPQAGAEFAAALSGMERSPAAMGGEPRAANPGAQTSGRHPRAANLGKPSSGGRA